VILW